MTRLTVARARVWWYGWGMTNSKITTYVGIVCAIAGFTVSLLTKDGMLSAGIGTALGAALMSFGKSLGAS